MIAFDFDYYRPRTIVEAINIFENYKEKGKKALFYGGGTEIISMARVNNIFMDAVIDIKGIPECGMFKIRDGKLYLGSGITLTEIKEGNLFPLLSKTVKRIADHTIQGKITLGGNLAGTIIYHEAILPLMISNAKIVIANKNGIKTISMNEFFNKRLLISKYDLIINIIVEEKYLTLPYEHVKITKIEKIDYPLITMASIRDKDKSYYGFSGLCEYPFRSIEMENLLKDKTKSIDERIKSAIEIVPGKILEDISGSSNYRKFVLENILKNSLESKR